MNLKDITNAIKKLMDDVNAKNDILLNMEELNEGKTKRDTSRYILNDSIKNLKKRELVNETVRFVSNKVNSYEELKKWFPDDLQGSCGVIRLPEELNKYKSEQEKEKRYYINKKIIVGGVECYTSKDWENINTNRFVEYANNVLNKEFGVIIKKVGDEDEQA